jgi:hypothetical protein
MDSITLYLNRIEDLVEYYCIFIQFQIIDKVKNTKLQELFFEYVKKKPSVLTSPLYLRCTYDKVLPLESYERRINLHDIHAYTILPIPIVSAPLRVMAKQLFKKIIRSKKLHWNGKPIRSKDCVLYDLFLSGITKINSFHTDIEYSVVTGNAFNVWYLIENNESYGNMFLLETDDYKKSYTPCLLRDEYKKDGIPVIQQSYIQNLTGRARELGILSKDTISITYTNMKNGECLIMSQHLLHRTDLTRASSFQGFNFRVLMKNEDGSIQYSKHYNKVKPYHIWDEDHHKIYGCKLMDFV